MIEHTKFDSLVSQNFAQTISRGDPLAASFIEAFGRYQRLVDDIIDNGTWDKESLGRALMMACLFYSHPFYQANITMLQMPMLLATNWYADSVDWEKQPELWKRQWADLLRHSGNDVIMAVALIKGGWQGARELSRPLLATCYMYHKDKYGVPQ